MDLPDSVDIFGKEVLIEEVSPCKDDDGNECDGMYCYKTGTIYLEKKQSKEAKIHSLIHEMGHALFDRVSLGQTKIESDIEEIIVNNIATLMTESFNIRFKRS